LIQVELPFPFSAAAAAVDETISASDEKIHSVQILKDKKEFVKS